MDFSYVFLSSGKIWSQDQQYILNHVLTWGIVAQLAVGGFAFLLAHRAAKALRSWKEGMVTCSDHVATSIMDF